MRISDWSSDVCSSDLDISAFRLRKTGTRRPKLSQLRLPIGYGGNSCFCLSPILILEGYSVDVVLIFTRRGAPFSIPAQGFAVAGGAFFSEEADCPAGAPCARNRLCLVAGIIRPMTYPAAVRFRAFFRGNWAREQLGWMEFV